MGMDEKKWKKNLPAASQNVQWGETVREKILISSIEETLDLEFSEYQKQLDRQIGRMNDALKRSRGKFLSDKDNREFKKLYRQIVKALHPDIHPGVTEAQIRLFDNAVSAYKNGDLEAMRLISDMLCGKPLPEQRNDAVTQLFEEKKRLQRSLEVIRKSIGKIRSEYPYTMKSLLENAEKTEERKQELENILRQYRELIPVYEAKIEEILR